MNRALRSLGAIVVIAYSDLARACPVCFDAADQNRSEYFWTFVLLTVTPLLAMGLVIYFVGRRILRAERAAGARETFRPVAPE